MRLDIVIPNYNSAGLIEKNFPEVVKILSTYKNIGKIIIVDDGSKKEQLNRIKVVIENNSIKNHPIVLIEIKKNRGFASTVNKGIQVSDADLVFLLNTDAIPEKGFLEPLIEDFSKDENLFAVGCTDKSIEGKDIVLRGRGIGRWENGFLLHTRGEIDKSNTLWVSGGSSILRRTLYKKIGGFDETFNPFYWEDIDLSYRALKSGHSILFDNRSILVHNHEEGAIKKHYNQFRITTIAYRNQFLFVWKNITDIDFLISHFFFIPYHMVNALMRFDIPFFLGVILALGKLPVIIGNRKKVKKLFVIKDRDILKNFQKL